MSEGNIKIESREEIAAEVPGIAARCQAIREILSVGPATWEELREGLRAALGLSEEIVLPMRDDLATLQVGGWVEAVPEEPGTFRLAAEA